MFAAFARLFALRPFFSMAILGIPVVTLVVIGLAAVWLFKLLVFVVLPIALVVWLVRRFTRKAPPLEEPPVMVSDL